MHYCTFCKGVREKLMKPPKWIIYIFLVILNLYCTIHQSIQPGLDRAKLVLAVHPTWHDEAPSYCRRKVYKSSHSEFSREILYVYLLTDNGGHADSFRAEIELFCM